VVSHSKKLTKKNKEQLSDMMMINKQKGGLKALSKEKREKLEAYQHLFYLLQVSSSRLGSKITQFTLPHSSLEGLLLSAEGCMKCYLFFSCTLSYYLE
jgi:hypothetical protein